MNSSKVWTGETDENGEPLQEFFTRRALGWADSKAHRHVKKGTGPNPNVPLYSWWKGEHLSYLEARKRIYCPIYAQLVEKTKEFQTLKKLVEDGTNLQILGYDGYDFQGEGKTLQEWFDDAGRPFGKCLIDYHF
jgi:hypothetical protein